MYKRNKTENLAPKPPWSAQSRLIIPDFLNGCSVFSQLRCSLHPYLIVHWTGHKCSVKSAVLLELSIWLFYSSANRLIRVGISNTYSASLDLIGLDLSFIKVGGRCNLLQRCVINSWDFRTVINAVEILQ